jgi:uncharacterized protein YecE (DUF72 family)
MIRVGTCGYSYPDWKGPFYPAALGPNQLLEYYARTFTAVEVDSTYYRVPPTATFSAMAARTPAGFRFCVKLPASGTHAPAAHADVGLLRANIAPLIDSGKFAAALMQFPNSFRRTPAAHDHIAALRDALSDIPLVAEFRGREWQTHETLDFLRELQIGWVNVDMPQFEKLMRPSTDVTTPLAYVRFHGRNYRQWWKGDNVTRYDYDYSAAELEPWADRIVDLAANTDVREVLSFFNNHRRGQAARNAALFEDMLRSRVPAAVAVPAAPPPAQQLAFDLRA